MANKEKSFDLATILSLTSGRCFTNMNNIMNALSYITNDDVFTHQIPRVIKTVGHYVLIKYPQLEGIGKTEVINSEKDAIKFINSQKNILGDTFKISPMPAELYQHIDPIEEAEEIMSGRSR